MKMDFHGAKYGNGDVLSGDQPLWGLVISIHSSAQPSDGDLSFKKEPEAQHSPSISHLSSDTPS